MRLEAEHSATYSLPWAEPEVNIDYTPKYRVKHCLAYPGDLELAKMLIGISGSTHFLVPVARGL